jgi:cob(I)alamin adenosyltransferase
MEEHKPVLDERIKGRQGYGLVQIFTGNGKGKTTAALGEALRALGAGKKVGIVFFDKGGTHYTERIILEKLQVEYVATGRDRIDPETGQFDFSVQDIDREEAICGLAAVKTFFQADYDLVVMDEINQTAHLGMIGVPDVLEVLRLKPERTEVIMTGRNAPKEFLACAHLVTLMQMDKHYFYSGVKAREGLDY